MFQNRYQQFLPRQESFPTLLAGAFIVRGLADDVTDVVDAVETKSQHALEAEPSDKSMNEIPVFPNGKGLGVRVLNEGRSFRCEGWGGKNRLRFYG